MKTNVAYLGIDIGGAHLKIVGIDKKRNVTFISYSKCEVWKGTSDLKKKLERLNSIIPHASVKCAISMTAELCDNFKNRKLGAKIILDQCKSLSFKKFFYVKSKDILTKKPKINDVISMNWHSLGRFIEDKIDDAILVDFGSTTTDFICIKNRKMQNKFFDDFSRINNYELLYTGLTRTPIFGLSNQIQIRNQIFQIIPEFFSNTSDIYRIKKQLNNKIDIDETADGSNKRIIDSLIRVSRSLGIDYNSRIKEKIIMICEEFYKIQMNQILKNIYNLQRRFLLKKNTPIIASGIGQDILLDFFEKKKIHFLPFQSLLKCERYKKEATYHAPALSLALLLEKEK